MAFGCIFEQNVVLQEIMASEIRLEGILEILWFEGNPPVRENKS